MTSNSSNNDKLNTRKNNEFESQPSLKNNLFDILFHNLAEKAYLWKIIKDDNGTILTWKLVDINTELLKTWKKKKEDVIGLTVNELFGNEILEQFSPIVSQIFETKKPVEWEGYFEPSKEYVNINSMAYGDYFISSVRSIAEKLKQENKLKESEKIINEIFNNTFNFIGLLEKDGSLIDVNKPTLDFVGFKKEDVISRKFYNAPWWLGENTRQELKNSIEKCSNGKLVRYEVSVLGKNKEKIVVDLTLKPILNEQKEVVYIIPEGRDITETVLYKNKLKDLNENLEKKILDRTLELEEAVKVIKEYKLAAEMSKIGLWKWNLKTNIQTWDDTIYDLYGVKKDDFETVVEACFSGIHPKDRERVKKEFQKCIQEGSSFDSIFEVIKKDTKEHINVRAKGRVDFDDNGNPEIIYGTKWNVSKELSISEERDIFEKELKQQYDLISAASIILILDREGKIIKINEEFSNKSGYSKNEVINKSYKTILDKSNTSEALYLELKNSLAEGKNWTGLLCSITKNGNKVWLQTTVSAFKNTQGEIEKFVSVSFDISEQKNLEIMARKNQKHLMAQSKELLKVSRELTKQKFLLQTVFDNTDLMIFIKDLKGKFILVNKKLVSNFKLSSEKEIIGKTDFDLCSNEDAKKFAAADKKVIQSGVQMSFEEHVTLPLGEKTFLTSKFPLYNDSFNVIGICGISVDITDKKESEIKLKETQAQLIQSEKMASLGVLTSGIAHEINNPLNYISGGYQSIEKHLENYDIPDTQKIKKFVGWIKTGTDRATSIVKGLSDLSRDNLDFNEDCNLDKIVNETLSILKNRYINKVNFVKEFNCGNCTIKGNIAKIHQLILQLITNAGDAITTEGTITIRLHENKEYKIIEVEDNGMGIEEVKLSKIMEPFYTTKPPGNGTGLGLYICNRIINEHKGKLKIKSTFGKGTIAIVKLPK